jgi:hypothetical protein
MKTLATEKYQFFIGYVLRYHLVSTFYYTQQLNLCKNCLWTAVSHNSMLRRHKHLNLEHPYFFTRWGPFKLGFSTQSYNDPNLFGSTHYKN